MHIGRIQTLAAIPVEAGASIELNMSGIARLAANRKEVVSECQLDIVAFFVPHRLAYGQAWIDFINAGVDGLDLIDGISIPAAYRSAPYLGINTLGPQAPGHLIRGYNSIFYNYFAVPSFVVTGDGADATNLNWFPTTEVGAANCRKYGRLAARLPHITNGGNLVDATSAANPAYKQDLTDADAQVPLGSGVFDIRDLARIQGRYKSEAQMAWFAHFYQDVMNERWGTDVSNDADPRNIRPTMLMRHIQMLSGTDIDGTDDATLGTFQGKTLERTSFNMPRKFFGEHGVVWVLMLPRYPMVHTDERHPMLYQVAQNYKDMAGDADIVSKEAPVRWDPQAWLDGTGIVMPVTTQQPFGQQYRFQPNRVHPNFKIIPGYPFSQFKASAQYQDWLYHYDEEYKETFQTTQIGQAQAQTRLNVFKYSPVPGPVSSIFAGTN